MKTMKKYIVLAAALFAAGCQESNEVVNPVDINEICVEASIANTRAHENRFEIGDKMSLYVVEYNGEEVAPLQISGNYINNEPLVYDGELWKGVRPLYWSKTHCDFYGIYPYQNPTSIGSYLFDLPTNQNSAETQDALSGYEAADLMWAKAEKIKPPYTTSTDDDGSVCTPPIVEDHYYPIQLKFKHMMSRVVVNIVRGPKYEGELPDDIVVHLYNTVTTAEVNLKKGSCQRYAYGDKNTIEMKKLANDTFAAIVVPQNIERKTPLVEITMDGIAYLLNYSMSFRPGYQHNITVTLNTSPDQEKIEISIDGGTGDWN